MNYKQLYIKNNNYLTHLKQIILFFIVIKLAIKKIYNSV